MWLIRYTDLDFSVMSDFQAANPTVDQYMTGILTFYLFRSIVC